MLQDPRFEAKFLAGLGEVDAACAERVRKKGCPECGGPLDRADYPRKVRGDLGEAEGAYARRLSFCCRRDGCRLRATPPSLRFLGRKIYFAVLVIVASVTGLQTAITGRGSARRVHGVPSRTVRRWLVWWQAVFTIGAFAAEARAHFAPPVEVSELPASLLSRFGESGTAAIEKMLSFIAPLTTTSAKTTIPMAG